VPCRRHVGQHGWTNHHTIMRTDSAQKRAFGITEPISTPDQLLLGTLASDSYARRHNWRLRWLCPLLSLGACSLLFRTKRAWSAPLPNKSCCSLDPWILATDLHSPHVGCEWSMIFFGARISGKVVNCKDRRFRCVSVFLAAMFDWQNRRQSMTDNYDIHTPFTDCSNYFQSSALLCTG